MKAASGDTRPVALVTGGARGIGLGISTCLAREGYDLAVCGTRVESAVVDVIRTLQAHGTEACYIQADIAGDTDRRRLIDTVRDRFGRLNVLVNNAGVAPHKRLGMLEATEQSYDRVMSINLKGPYFLTQLAARWLVEQKNANSSFAGTIVTITSISSTVASPSRGEYCVSKAGLSMMTRLWALELASRGIPVYEVRPGITRTDMTAGVKEKYDRLIDEGLVPQNRWGEPDDVGRAVAMLARGELPYSTGQVIMVDGGLTVERL